MSCRSDEHINPSHIYPASHCQGRLEEACVLIVIGVSIILSESPLLRYV
jgi:hypothetical protein